MEEVQEEEEEGFSLVLLIKVRLVEVVVEGGFRRAEEVDLCLFGDEEGTIKTPPPLTEDLAGPEEEEELLLLLLMLLLAEPGQLLLLLLADELIPDELGVPAMLPPPDPPATIPPTKFAPLFPLLHPLCPL